MCRFAAYSGKALMIADVLVKPTDSLIKQSLKAKETSTTTNGDGFGLGWYLPEISENPAVFLSIMPAWNDENLLHLANLTKSSLFFGHVRSASTGGVNSYNCHPFVYKNWMLMHNGDIFNFSLIKRALRRLLDDDLYNWIRGDTDSEHFFALFLQLAKGKDLRQLSVIAEVMRMTIQTIEELIHQTGLEGTSWYNLCLTDGIRLVASRFCTDKILKPESLHYLKGYSWSERIIKPDEKSVLISSEKLTDFNDSLWQTVPANHCILVDADYSIRIEPILLD